MPSGCMSTDTDGTLSERQNVRVRAAAVNMFFVRASAAAGRVAGRPFLGAPLSLGGKERVRRKTFFVGLRLRLQRIGSAFFFGRKTDFLFGLYVNGQQMIQRFKDNLKAVIGLAF